LKYLTRTIWILSLISLFTDKASEMLYPILPIYLNHIGFSVMFIGLLEGVAEATAGLSKGYFGKLSDHLGKKTPFVQLGYSLSALSKPLLALFTYPLWIFFSRTLDRLGKGIRTGARDALLSAESSPANKGKVFGFHRSMDTTGAVLGPLLALLYLNYHPGSYRPLFFIAFIPGCLAVLCSGILKKRETQMEKQGPRPGFFSFLSYWKNGSPAYRKLVGGLLVFALFNSSDVFLLLKGKQCGLSDSSLVWVYIFYNLIYAFGSFPLGILADKMGLKRIFLMGLLLFFLVYGGMSLSNNTIVYILLYLVYGLYAAATDGVSKAWISHLVVKKDLGATLGGFAGYQSICALLASSLTGFIWLQFGQGPAFLTSAIVTLMVILYLKIWASSPVIGETT
jgi:MFS family permease